MKTMTRLISAALAPFYLAAPVWAHAGHDEGMGVLHDLKHSLGGIDAIALLAIGLVVAAFCGQRLRLLRRR